MTVELRAPIGRPASPDAGSAAHHAPGAGHLCMPPPKCPPAGADMCPPKAGRGAMAGAAWYAGGATTGAARYVGGAT